MKNNNLQAMLLIAVIIIQSCNSANRTENMDDSTAVDHTKVDTAMLTRTTPLENGAEGAMFMEKAAIGGMLEVELGKLAWQKAKSNKVKEFGALMEKDHNELNAALKVLAKSKGMKLPASLPVKEQEQFNEMNSMSGDNFEKHYMDMMVEDHIKDIELFKGAGKSPDTTISSFATRALPVLEQHYKKAKEISASLK